MMNTYYWVSLRCSLKMCLLLLVFVAFGARNIYAQSSSLHNLALQKAQTSHHASDKLLISVNIKKLNLADALRKVAHKAHVGISFNAKSLPARKVIMNVKNMSIYEVLRQLLRGTGLEAVRSKGGDVLIIQKKPTLKLAAVQQQTVSGTVTDAQTGDPLVGANIFVVGTSTGGITNANGYYSLVVPSLQDTLRFSFIGYQTQAVPIGGQTEIDVQLKPTIISGEQMVVIGYGMQKKENVTTSISTVQGKAIAKVPASNVANALAGQLPGVQIKQSTGQPGARDPSIYVRGVSTLNAESAHPLFVVDGVIMSSERAVTQLNPNAIAKISVLKGAAATAIYGIQGANGVIVVKTKRGERGPIQISASFSAGFQSPTTHLDMVNDYAYVKAYDLAQTLDGVSLDHLKYTSKALEAYRTGTYPLIYPRTDWQHALFKERAFESKTGISLSGGTDHVRFFIAGQYLYTGGMFKTFKSKYNYNPRYGRYNLRANLDVDITPTTELSLTSSSRIGSRLQIRSHTNGPAGLWIGVIKAAPTGGNIAFHNGGLVVPGDLYISGSKFNPLGSLFGRGYNRYTRNVNHLNLSVTQQLDAIINGLQFKLKGSYNTKFLKTVQRERFFRVRYTPFFKTDLVHTPEAKGDSSIVFRKSGKDGVLQYNESYGIQKNWYVEARLNYKHSFGPHSINVLLLAGQRRRFYPSSYTGIPKNLVTTVGRINYNYKERYLLQFSMGYNGSENFAKGQRFGFFPAVSAGWIITNEPYMPEIPFLDYLKLWGSWGIVGNARGVGRFLYLPTVYNPHAPGVNLGYNIPQDKIGAEVTALGNPNVTWETSHKRNFGIDIRMFSNKLSMSFDYFHEVRTNILIHQPLQDYVAVSFPLVNKGKVQNKGWEAQVKWSQQAGDFFYSIRGNLSFNRNKILYMAETPPLVPWQARTGQPVGQIFGYVFQGFYTKKEISNFGNGVPKPGWAVKPGYLKYKDINDDMVINGLDQVPIGYPTHPEYTYGTTMNFRYKDISLSMTFAGQNNVSLVLSGSPYRSAFGKKGKASIMEWQWEGRWTPKKGQNSTYPRLSLEAKSLRDTHNSDFWTVDASYVRLKNVKISYNLPQRFLKNLGIENLQVYANAYNLFTISGMLRKYSIDPAKGHYAFSSASYPIMKVYNFGIKIDF